MKRKGNLYQNICDFNNIMKEYNYVCSKTKNKKKVGKYNLNKCSNIYDIYTTLNEKTYVPDKYNEFTIYEPKERKIISLSMKDKVIDRLVSIYILSPSISKCLIDENVASRKGMGVSKALKLKMKFDKKFKDKNVEYYILKCDIKKFFASINIDILKEKIENKIKDKNALDIVFNILNNEKCGLNIGSMNSQLLAVFF